MPKRTDIKSVKIDEAILAKAGLSHFRFLDAIAELQFVEAIYLFGSRARGDFLDKSDIDLAIKYDDKDEYHRKIVKAIIREAKDTFLEVDLLDCDSDSLSEEFRKSIEEEKKILYEAS
jgi:predicted nucleotidyltransferase